MDDTDDDTRLDAFEAPTDVVDDPERILDIVVVVVAAVLAVLAVLVLVDDGALVLENDEM